MKLIIVGGGPAGMMAAYQLMKDHEVILLERNNSLGKKLLVTGNGRCNITNNKPTKELIKRIHHGKFLFSALSKFHPQAIISFFNENGVPLKEEDNQRMFPESDKAVDILKVFEEELNKITKFNTKVIDLLIENDEIKGVITETGTILADRVIMATGGVSYGALGSDGLGHEILQKHGVEITDLYPVETSLISREPLDLQGLTLKNKKVMVKDNHQKVVYSTTGDVLFTHFGLSGPAIMLCSEHVHHLLKVQESVSLECALISHYTQEAFFTQIVSQPAKKLTNVLSFYLPKRMVSFVLNLQGIDENALVRELSHKRVRQLIEALFHFKVEIHEVMDIKKAIVTGGGVSLDEVNPQNFASKRFKNLFMIGELLDLHGEMGGYNLTLALVSGYVCAREVSASQLTS